MKPKTFEIRGIEWVISTTKDGTKRAIATCPDHPKQESGILEALADRVLVWCPRCGAILEMCSKEELASERETILANFQSTDSQK
jgi:hypothetical protein